MRIVVDTNVIVSALLKAGSVPERALEAILAMSTVLIDERVIAEYTAVLDRPKFGAIDRMRIAALLAEVRARGVAVPHAGTRMIPAALRDPSDACFVELALAGSADAIVTGNIKDFPPDLGFEVLPPATILARLGGPLGPAAK